jgi:hypothetical protein
VTDEELEAAFTNAAERLHALRIMCTLPFDDDKLRA